eukprot:TRINITY_DN1829_c0_g2_i2.p1 TRINITY_DN1829_c0_g2~~TRINITY_DN1829_c0_g2_i2.p1  ORF type:complete len:269 (+),score=53.22 TRINITY_DN1829_c0_g2_i2:124-930(+)
MKSQKRSVPKRVDYASQDAQFLHFLRNSPFFTQVKQHIVEGERAEEDDVLVGLADNGGDLKILANKADTKRISEEESARLASLSKRQESIKGKQLRVGDSSSEDEEEIRRVSARKEETEHSRVILTTETEKAQRKAIDGLQERVFLLENEMKVFRRDKHELEQINKRLLGQVETLSIEKDNLFKEKLKTDARLRKVETTALSNEKVYSVVKGLIQPPVHQKESPLLQQKQASNALLVKQNDTARQGTSRGLMTTARMSGNTSKEIGSK